MKDSDNSVFYRFPVFVEDSSGEEIPVGAAYHREGHRVWALKLLTFPTLKFFLMRDKDDPSIVLIFTREERKTQRAGKGKYFWNLVGRGATDVPNEVVRLKLHLFDKPLLMSLFPSKAPAGQAEFEEILEVS